MPRTQTYNTTSQDGDRIWKTRDAFGSTYWSGLDARVYANDVFLDEVLSLEYNLQEAVAPLFNYASYTYETLMHGARRVQGSFTINFKRDGYLFELLETLAGNPEKEIRNFDETEIYRVARTGEATVETFLALAARGNNVVRDDQGRVKADPTLIRNVAREFEQAIWGRGGFADTGDLSANRFARQTEERRSLRRPRFELTKRFDINIQFGSIPFKHLNREEVAGGISQQEKSRAEENIPVSTYSRIIGVAIMGEDKVIDDSGRNVVARYTFLARDVL
jgi:hypothetical protein